MRQTIRRRAKCSDRRCTAPSWTIYPADAYPHRSFQLDVVTSAVALRSLGQQVFRRIATTATFELLVGNFDHGPYVRIVDGSLRRALLGAHIDHFSRYVPEGRYFLHEDYVALRFGFRRLLTGFGLFRTYYVDRGTRVPSHPLSRRL